jgi:cobalt/nickel transport system permease protein
VNVHSSIVEGYVSGTSVVHRLDPRLKLLAALATVLTVTITPPPAWYALLSLAALGWMAMLASSIPVTTMLKRASIALPFAGMAAISLPFTQAGEALWSGGLLGWTLTITDQGLWLFLSVIAKAWLSVLVSGLLVATTPFPELLKAMRRLHMPAVLVTIVAFTYRYLFVLGDEALCLQRARAARSAGPGGTVLWRVKVLGGMIGSLFIRSYERSERIYQAMLSRGYTGELQTMAQLSWEARDTWVSAGWSAALIATAVLGSVTV